MNADIVIVGAGTAGLPAAICAAERGARVILLEGSASIGGTLGNARELSASGTRQQKAKGIVDSARAHFEEVMALSKGEANAPLLRLALDNAADTIDWLETVGVRIDPETPQIVFNHEAYKTPRTYWAIDSGAEIVRVLGARLDALVDAGRVKLRLLTSLESLIVEDNAVTGVSACRSNGESVKYRTDKVLLATGGYAANQALYRRFHSVDQILAWAPEHAQGEGLQAAANVGAELTGHNGFNLSFGGVMEGDGPSRKILCRLNTLPQLRQPWEIIVNRRGERFIREDIPSIDAQEQALMNQPEYCGFMVFDDAIRTTAPDRIRKWYIQDGVENFEKHEWFYGAGTLSELADAAGIDGDRLEDTVARYNKAQGSGTDQLGRLHMPAPITRPPFFAIRFQGCNVISPVGIRTDTTLQALRADGTAIENLFVAGEVIGSCQLMGRSAAGGMMATPALTFGRMLGQTLAFASLQSQTAWQSTETGEMK